MRISGEHGGPELSGEHGGPELAVTPLTLLLARHLGSVRDVVRESAVLRALLAAGTDARAAAPAARSGRRQPRVARALDAGHLSGRRGK